MGFRCKTKNTLRIGRGGGIIREYYCNPINPLRFTRDSTIIIIIIVLLIILLMMAGPNISSVTGKTIRTVRFGFRTPRILIWFCNFSSQQSRTLFEGPKCLGFVPCIQIKLKAHSLIIEVRLTFRVIK